MVLTGIVSENTNTFEAEWDLFKKTFEKQYADEIEDEYRSKIFANNLIIITEHNRRYELGEETYEMGKNIFTDMTEDEISDLKLGYTRFSSSEYKNQKLKILSCPLSLKQEESLPTHVDWRDKGIVSPVQNQGVCGSCWAFVAAGAAESQLALKTGRLVVLSAQYLIDCSKMYGNQGCVAGHMILAYDYMIANGGIATDESYPYEDDETKECRYSKEQSGGSISAYFNVSGEEKMKAAVAKIGPISAAMNALPSFKYYKSGPYWREKCNPEDLNHAVLIVGYGEENGTKYWIVKNTWGPQWGENGYFRMIRDINLCGIGEEASYPVV